jgi:hypothetical protein
MFVLYPSPSTEKVGKLCIEFNVSRPTLNKIRRGLVAKTNPLVDPVSPPVKLCTETKLAARTEFIQGSGVHSAASRGIRKRFQVITDFSAERFIHVGPDEVNLQEHVVDYLRSVGAFFSSNGNRSIKRNFKGEAEAETVI